MSQQYQPPNRIALYSPQPLTACTAAALYSQMDFLGPSSNLTIMDKSRVWVDPLHGAAALVVGSGARSCPTNVEETLSGLPIRDRIAMREEVGGDQCEQAIDDVDVARLSAVFDALFNDILSANAHFPTLLPENATEDSNPIAIPSIPCPAWHHIPPPTSPAHIPILKTQGPAVDSIFDLIRVALKITSVSPTFADLPPLDDAFIAAVANLCQQCARFEGVSYQAVVDAYRGVKMGQCKSTLFGGIGKVVDRVIVAHAEKNTVVETASERKRTDAVSVARVVKVGSAQEPVWYFPDCANGTVLVMDLDARRPANGNAVIAEVVVHPPTYLESVGMQALYNASTENATSVMTAVPGVGRDGESVSLSVNITGSLHGFYSFNVTAWTETKAGRRDVITNFTQTVVCGYVPAVQSLPGVRAPERDTLVEIFQNVPELKVSGTVIPSKHH
ncbi:hypothetical protein HK104_007126, partial [Borealophlyctis nickersoniae]